MKYSLDAAAKVAEVIGGVAVVVGLLFVGFEVRGNTVAQQFSATQALVSEYNSAIRSINDEDFVCTYIEGSSNFNALSQSEKIRYSIQMQPIFRTFEQLHYAALHGIIDENVHSGFQRQFAAIMQLQGNREFWEARRDWFGDAFQQHVASVVSGKQMVEPANFALEQCE